MSDKFHRLNRSTKTDSGNPRTVPVALSADTTLQINIIFCGCQTRFQQFSQVLNAEMLNPNSGTNIIFPSNSPEVTSFLSILIKQSKSRLKSCKASKIVFNGLKVRQKSIFSFFCASFLAKMTILAILRLINQSDIICQTGNVSSILKFLRLQVRVQ